MRETANSSDSTFRFLGQSFTPRHGRDNSLNRSRFGARWRSARSSETKNTLRSERGRGRVVRTVLTGGLQGYGRPSEDHGGQSFNWSVVVQIEHQAMTDLAGTGGVVPVRQPAELHSASRAAELRAGERE